MKKDVERLIRFAILGYPQNVIPEDLKELYEELKKKGIKELEKELRRSEYEALEKYLKEEKTVPLPDINGEAFTLYKLFHNYLAPLWEGMREVLDKDTQLREKLSKYSGMKMKLTISKPNPSFLWKVFTLEKGSSRSFTPIAILAMLIFLVEKGILGKRDKKTAKKWVGYWKAYGEYLIKDFDEIYKILKLYMEKIYEEKIKGVSKATT